jgi:hypothetical protein
LVERANIFNSEESTGKKSLIGLLSIYLPRAIFVSQYSIQFVSLVKKAPKKINQGGNDKYKPLKSGSN